MKLFKDHDSSDEDEKEFYKRTFEKKVEDNTKEYRNDLYDAKTLIMEANKNKGVYPNKIWNYLLDVYQNKLRPIHIDVPDKEKAKVTILNKEGKSMTIDFFQGDICGLDGPPVQGDVLCINTNRDISLHGPVANKIAKVAGWVELDHNVAEYLNDFSRLDRGGVAVCKPFKLKDEGDRKCDYLMFTNSLDGWSHPYK